jgi:phosphoribosylamine--glycine ligase
LNVLIIDADRCGLDFAVRCAEAGHAVRYFVDSPTPVRDGEGFPGVTRVKDWHEHMHWAKDGLVLPTTNTKYLKELDQWRSHEYPVFGPTWDSARLEIDRAAGMRVFEEYGLPVLPYKVFKSLALAEAFARQADDLYVFKTLGSDEDKALSFCPDDPAELVAKIVQWQRRGLKLKGPCMLQEKVKMVAEIGVSGWIGPAGWLPGKWSENFEYKKLMSGNFGPNTGEMGSILHYTARSQLAEEMLIPLTRYLLECGHTGDFDINCGIDSDGLAYPFEPTARLGWPAFYIQVASHAGEDPAQWMRDCLDGHDTLSVDERVAIGLLVAQPGFPYKHIQQAEVEGNPVYYDEVDREHIHPIQVMQGTVPHMSDGKVADGPGWITTGEYVCCLTALSETVSGAQDDVYELASAVHVPDMIVRDDVGENLQDCLSDLHAWGYALGIEYDAASSRSRRKAG